MIMFSSAQKGHMTFFPIDHLSLSIMIAQAVTSQADISIQSWVAFLWVCFEGSDEDLFLFIQNFQAKPLFHIPCRGETAVGTWGEKSAFVGLSESGVSTEVV